MQAYFFIRTLSNDIIRSIRPIPFFFYSVLANLHTTTYKNEINGLKKAEDNKKTSKHDLVTPYMAMGVTRDNSMLMTSPTSSHLMLKHL